MPPDHASAMHAAQDARNRARIEDLAWMAAHGETVDGAADRLGINRKSLEKWCHRNTPELWRQLVANEATAARVRRGAIRGWRVA